MSTSAGTRRPAWVTAVAVLVILAVVGFGIYGIMRSRRPGPGVKAADTEPAETWTCPMHPQIVRPEPGNCPICGMNLVPVKKTEKPSEQKPPGISGQAVIEIDPKKQQLIGVVTTAVKRQPVRRVVRTVGRVTVDESRLSHVHTKVEGWIEKLHANETGKLVRKGEPLLTIYSPELVSTQQEYLVALRSRERVAESPFPEVRQSAESLLDAARERLRLWDISENDLQHLEKTGQVRKTLTLYAPATGYIMDKEALEGMRVMPDMILFQLADLSRVWVEANVYEFEAPVVKVGQPAKLTLQAHPGQVFAGRVSYIYPTLEEMTRTLKARLEFANPGLGLKPGMYANVEIVAQAGEELVIPEQAVVDTGTRRVVFVKQGEGTFVPREVTLGPRAVGYYPVLSGLEEGEQVVSSPNFLIDSESRFQAAIEETGTPAAGEGARAGHGG